MSVRTLKPETGEISVIVFTILDRDTDLELAEEVGADDYLTKPFELNELVKKHRG